MAQLVAITGKTFPVKEQLKRLGARWDPDRKAWMVPSEHAERARQIVSGQATLREATIIQQHAPGMVTDKQRATIGKLLRRVQHILQFDSFSGDGDQVAEDVRHQIEQWGGMAALTSKQASQLIGQLIDAAEDEM